jgi:pyochelin biosynthetic protein PchC
VAGTDTGGEAWIRRFHPATEGAPTPPRLVCFAHAGGSASYFHGLSGLLAPAVEVLALQYPGRQDRHSEAAPTDLRTLAEEIAEVLRPWAAQGPLAYFGHSMGALVAFETARRLPPSALFLSGRRAPSTYRAERVHLLDDDGLVAETALLGGTDTRLLQDPEIRALVLPVLRADYRALETYRPDPECVVDAPVEVLLGDRDPRVTEEEARAWKAHTTGGLALRLFAGGGHFYLAEPERRAELAALITDRLAPPAR